MGFALNPDRRLVFATTLHRLAPRSKRDREKSTITTNVNLYITHVKVYTT